MSSEQCKSVFPDSGKSTCADNLGVIGCNKGVNSFYSDSCTPVHVSACKDKHFNDATSVPTFESSDEPVSFLVLLQSILDQSSASHIGLNQFIRQSLQPVHSRFVHNAPRGVDLWPCPMPLWSWTGSVHPSPRRRQRRKFLQVKASLLQRAIGVLNWECLGHPTLPPPEACAGFGFTNDQFDMIARLERLIDHFLQAGPLSAQDLGRSGEKFNRMIRASKELPEFREVDLFELTREIASSLDPYSRQKCERGSAPTDVPTSDLSSNLGNPCPLPSSVAKPVIASRIKWEHSPKFDPLPFFEDPIVKAAFLDPQNVKLPESEWPHQPKGKVHCSRRELLELASKWDSKGACKIFRKDQILFDEAVGIFAVPKDETYDRLILNPQTANSRLQKFSHYTRELAPGSMFALIWLQEGQCFRVSADDLAEMYYTFLVPELRAKRNSIGTLFSASELSHLSCYDPSVHYGPCVISLAALAMGDSWAVEFAQQSHHNVLRYLGGSMLEHQRVAYRKPFPRSDFLEWLSIDDHIGVQLLSKNHLKLQTPLRDSQVFSKAETAYKTVGLVQHPKKKQRGVTSGIFLGAEIDGVAGFVSAPRHRIGVLMLVTVLLARKGTASPRLLSSVIGCWIHILMFRRPVMSILSHSFSDGRGLPQDQIFRLSSETRNELFALALLGPLCIVDLRVQVAPRIFCTDASPDGAGICECPEAPHVVAEFWRHSEQGGYYTKLLNPSAEVLSGLDEKFEETDLPDFDHEPLDAAFRVPAPMFEGIVYDCLELFRGEGNWSNAHQQLGYEVHPGIDIKGTGLKFADMMNDSVFHQLVQLALRGVVADWHAGPPCWTYGTLRRPRIRSKACPAGFNIRDPLTREQTILALRTAFIMNIVRLTGRWFSVEQPGSSVMFHLDIFRRLVEQGAIITRMCFCAFGSPFMKPSKWLHNKPWLLPLEQPCRCSGISPHFVIEGSFTRASLVRFEQMCSPSVYEVYGRMPQVGEPVSAYSASYPKSLCRRMASGHQQARSDTVGLIPVSAHLRSLTRVGINPEMPPSVTREPLAASRPFHEDPEWIEELSDSLPFTELCRYKFRKGGHINVLECRVHKTWLKHCAKKYPNSRVLALLDSRVTLGATSKGRSSSKALCRVLQGSLGYILGGGLYPGGLHICSAKNRSDGPSRNRPVPPRSKDAPDWLVALRDRDYSKFDKIVLASRFTKLEARWLRFLLLLGGDIERNPGPVRPAGARGPRGPLDLNVGFKPVTSKRMNSCVSDFAVWLRGQLNLELDEIVWDVQAAPLALRAYGMWLFASGAARYRLVYALTGIQDGYPHLRPFLSSAWQVDRKWQQHEPGACRPVLSEPIMKAICSVALLWSWHRWLAVTLIGFLGMLHPAEFITLTRADVLLPRDTLVDKEVMYIFIRAPKTSRFARRQHCKIDDPLAVKFVDFLIGGRDGKELIFPAGVTAYRRRWNAVLGKLGIPYLQQNDGCTPAVLRGSGATHMFLCTEDIPRVQWRGRWAQAKTLEFYIQEAAAQSMLARLAPEAFKQVKFSSQFAASLIASHCSVDSQSNDGADDVV